MNKSESALVTLSDLLFPSSEAEFLLENETTTPATKMVDLASFDKASTTANPYNSPPLEVTLLYLLTYVPVNYFHILLLVTKHYKTFL